MNFEGMDVQTLCDLVKSELYELVGAGGELKDPCALVEIGETIGQFWAGDGWSAQDRELEFGDELVALVERAVVVQGPLLDIIKAWKTNNLWRH
jgi:hypothetical protein